VSTSGEPGRGFHHGDLRRVLVETATEMVEDAGPGAVSLREVARRAEVSHNAPYRHFPTREALLASVAEQGFALLGVELQEASETGGLSSMGTVYLEFARRRTGLFRLMFGGEIDLSEYPEAQEAAQAAFDRLRAAVPGDEDVRYRNVGAWALVHGLAWLLIEHQLSDDLVAQADTGILLERVSAVFGLRGG
jgi:AcrR family transcriptional regulator